MPKTATHKILIDENWSLIDLYKFPHAYTNVYGFIYSLIETKPQQEESISSIYRRYPWRGGYSAVNFYSDLYGAMGKDRQPMVKSIQYSSPGFIEICSVTLLVVSQLETIVKSLANAIDYANQTYDRIRCSAMKRKLLSLDVKRREREFNQEEVEFMVKSAKELSTLLNFDGLEKLQSRTQDDLATLKIMLSFYRRSTELAEFYQSGKARFEYQSQREYLSAASVQDFVVGKRYTRKQISARFGGGEISFLPTHDGHVVCGCFTLEYNPEAPDVIIPGTGKLIEHEAELFCRQENPIPVFIKRHPNEWEYIGDYKMWDFSTDRAEIAKHHRGSITPLEQITRVIFLKKV